MAFKKGHIKSPLSGVKLGQKTAPTLRREELRVKFQMMEDNIFNYAATLPPEKLTKFYLELKEYFDPKLSRVENKQEGPIIIKLDHLTDAEIKALENL